MGAEMIIGCVLAAIILLRWLKWLRGPPVAVTGQRKSEVAEARWSEFDLTKSFGKSLPNA
jgi:hypothetical protein